MALLRRLPLLFILICGTSTCAEARQGASAPHEAQLHAPAAPAAQAPAAQAPTAEPDTAAPPAEQAPSAQAPGTYEPQSGQEGKDVVWVPTPEALVERMLDIANVGPADYVMDLGSGDGRTVIGAAKRGARAVGVEFNPDMVALSKRRAAEAGVEGRVTFVEGDLFEADLSKATVITMFLLPSINVQLRPKLLELEPGTRIVSNSFSMEDWEPDDRSALPDEAGCQSWCTALLWIVPAKVAGTWRLGGEELRLEQQFQEVTGTLGGRPLADGKVRGREIHFTVEGKAYAGRANGSTIEGTVRAGEPQMWTATRVGGAVASSSGR
jgi:SAM-dependent methyltransferase